MTSELQYVHAACRKVYTLGRRSHAELRQWFGIGVLVAGMLGISSAFILLRELWQAIRWADEVSFSSPWLPHKRNLRSLLISILCASSLRNQLINDLAFPLSKHDRAGHELCLVGLIRSSSAHRVYPSSACSNYLPSTLSSSKLPCSHPQ